MIDQQNKKGPRKTIIQKENDLKSGKMLSSENGIYNLWMEKDGNLELHKRKNRKWDVIWASRTTGGGDPPYRLFLDETTNKLVIEDKHSHAIWNSGVGVSPKNNWVEGGYAALEENGNLVVYDGLKRVMWSTDTSGGVKSSKFGSGRINLSMF